VVNIHFIGSVDGVEFPGGTGTSDVTAGTPQFIDDFLWQIIGHTPGETIDINVTFPESYHEPSLAGKPALFVTTINHIAEPIENPSDEQIDEFIASVIAPNMNKSWQNAAEMNVGVHQEIQNNEVRGFIRSYIKENTVTITTNERLVARMEALTLEQYKNDAEQYGMSFAELLEAFEIESVDDLLAEYRQQNVENVVYQLSLQAIAADMGITINESDLDEYFLEHFGDSDYSGFEGIFGLPYLKHVVMQDTILDFLVENAVLL
jgi:trigger factor